ncbi:CmcI family methyltransferase [Paraburkholderia phenazinium]|uniref:Cephalosporin hydroxylase n=1 Tax=Paraburkholderia phenazinium TaxID=60549 RepID=A0A1N6GWX8_9BURK|nr:CmcI family methyltransferase [Paraburkholderia phenazinium]SIO11947.1 Cephalosporin hydroxylase [Paraburkholderia phenazinium]
MSERISSRMRDINIEWLTRAAEFDHLFHTRWLGERFFHLPGDMLAIQELIWRERPDCIVQTGIAGRVVAIEPRLRDEVKARLQSNRLAHRMVLIEGESCSAATLASVREQIDGCASVMVILDLTHTHEHVLRELECYAGLATPGSYVIVMDTIMEYLPERMFHGKPYGRGNNPATAAQAFLARDTRFEVDGDIEDRVLMTLSPGGFLKRVR